jgi:hypothetical protein
MPRYCSGFTSVVSHFVLQQAATAKHYTSNYKGCDSDRKQYIAMPEAHRRCTSDVELNSRLGFIK